jgi:enamine deaminase RidA (YjgF/YER057c/UK114 family)
MARRVLTPPADGKPVGMYSAGFEVDPGRVVFVAGQVAIDGAGRVVGEGDFAAQAAQVYRNLGAILAEAGCGFGDVVKFTTYLTRHQDFAAFTEFRKREYPRLFPDGVYPPNTGVVVTALARPELLLEVEAIAVRPGRAPRRAGARTASRGDRSRTARHGQSKRPSRR